MSKKKFFLLLTLLFSLSVFSQDRSNLFDRANKREGTRWTLSEWLAQKERNKLMDLWLAMNTPSPYEFMLGLSHNNYKMSENQNSQEFTNTSGEVLAYAKFFGLGVEYENRNGENENDLSGMLNLRLLGNSIQSTHLTVHFGQRTRTLTDVTPALLLRNQFAQASLQLYLNPFVGLRGQYRHYLPTSDISLGDVTGQLTTGGIFIDFSALRIYGEWFEDIQKNTGATVAPEIKRTGIKTGLQLYF